MQGKDLSEIRSDYLQGRLDISDVHADPLEQFGIWMDQAMKSGIEEPTAVMLATASAKGIPSARMVLLKGFDRNGFVFFTNYRSLKARDLEENPHAALVFYWKELERQVRVEGPVSRVSPQESDEYFASRPEESQVSAIISAQSSPVPDRNYLESIRDEYLKSHSGKHCRPNYWGGYRVMPHMVEFWQGRPGRLHDRLRYRCTSDGWNIQRLAP